MARKRPVGWRDHPHEHALAARGISTRQRVLRAEGVVTDIAKFPSSISIDYEEPEEVFALFWASSLSGDFSNFDFDRAFEEAAMRINNQLRMHGLLGPEEYQFWLEDTYVWPMAVLDFASSGSFLSKWENDDIMERIEEMVLGTGEYQDYAVTDAKEYVDGIDDYDLSTMVAYHGSNPRLSLEEQRERLRAVVEGRALRGSGTTLENYTSDLIGDIDVPLPDWIAENLVKEQSDEWKDRLLGEGAGYDEGAYPDLMETYEQLQSPPKDLQGKVLLMDRIIHAQHLGGSIWEDVEVERLRSRVEAASRRARVGEA